MVVSRLVLLALIAALLLPEPAWAGSLQPPPNVELDPDRGMTFGRLPKTTFDGKILGSTRQALKSRVMRPSIDPYNTQIRSERYDPGSGRIHGGVTDKYRRIKRNQELTRRARKRQEDLSPAGLPAAAGR